MKSKSENQKVLDCPKCRIPLIAVSDYTQYLCPDCGAVIGSERVRIELAPAG